MDKFGKEYMKYERSFPDGKIWNDKVTDDGEVISEFRQRYRYWDSDNFVNVYVNAIKEDFKLTNSSWKVFMMLLLNYRDKQTDVIHLHWKDTIVNLKVSKNTYYGAIKELEAANIIAKHDTLPFCFYINKNYMFKGNRFKISKEYHLTEEEQMDE